MKMSRAIVSLLTLLAVGGFALASTAGEAEESYTYKGAKKCKMCHKKEAAGKQWAIWSEGPHAKAYETLASEKALEAAKTRGIEDPQKAPECLSCHATAFPVMDDLANQKITMEEGVSCESCHGPGSGYYKKKTMKAIYNGDTVPESVGLWTITEETCTVCHKEDENNDFFEGFDYAEYVKRIAHPIPEK